MKKKTLYSNARHNLINGGSGTSTTNVKSISSPGVASTMMACPDVEVEGKILKAMNEVRSLDKFSDGGIGLYGVNNVLVIVLEKQDIRTILNKYACVVHNDTGISSIPSQSILLLY